MTTLPMHSAAVRARPKPQPRKKGDRPNAPKAPPRVVRYDAGVPVVRYGPFEYRRSSQGIEFREPSWKTTRRLIWALVDLRAFALQSSRFGVNPGIALALEAPEISP